MEISAGKHDTGKVKAFPYVGFKAPSDLHHKAHKEHKGKEKLFLVLFAVKENCHGGTETRRREKKLFLCVSVTLWLKLS